MSHPMPNAGAPLSASFADSQLKERQPRIQPGAIIPERLSKALVGFTLGGLAACGAVTLTNPMEVVKTRLQLQGELARAQSGAALPMKPYSNIFQALKLIFRHEGLRGIQKGLGAAYGYQLMMNGARLGFYDPIKRLFNDTLGMDPAKRHHFICVMSGASAGVIGAALGSPLFLVKTRMQSYSPTAGVGHQHYYRNTFAALVQIYQSNGVRGLYRGMNAAILRTGVGSSVQLPTYEFTKSHLLASPLLDLQDDVRTHLMSSLVSSFFVVLAMNPFDVVSTRMYNQKIDEITGRGLLYRGPIDCLIKTVRTEGVKGLYKGITAQYSRLGPHTIMTFVFYEQLKRLYGKHLSTLDT
ncbi:uncharacterized protein VTP21DRAFT_8506 [Calcarisporiella thermophila]|uniref:uncharacterized protein n=1 Tax=Calcarisporiella thermophila TaxID=911321 RepID=UPI0037433311